MKYQNILWLSQVGNFDTDFYAAGLVLESSVVKKIITEPRHTNLSLTSIHIEMPVGRTAMNSD